MTIESRRESSPFFRIYFFRRESVHTRGVDTRASAEFEENLDRGGCSEVGGDHDHMNEFLDFNSLSRKKYVVYKHATFLQSPLFDDVALWGLFYADAVEIPLPNVLFFVLFPPLFF